MTNLPLALVVWNDAWTDESATTLDTVAAKHRPEPINTLGWILRDDDVGITIANEYYDNTYRGRTFIPRGMVLTVTHYKLTKPRRKSPPKHEKSQ